MRIAEGLRVIHEMARVVTGLTGVADSATARTSPVCRLMSASPCRRVSRRFDLVTVPTDGPSGMTHSAAVHVLCEGSVRRRPLVPVVLCRPWEKVVAVAHQTLSRGEYLAEEWLLVPGRELPLVTHRAVLVLPLGPHAPPLDIGVKRTVALEAEEAIGTKHHRCTCGGIRPEAGACDVPHPVRTMTVSTREVGHFKAHVEVHIDVDARRCRG